MTAEGSTADRGPLDYWAAGVLEAKGAFYVVVGATGLRRGRIQCRLPDREVLDRLREVLGAGRVNGPYAAPRGTLGHRPTWAFQVNRQGDVVRVAASLKPLMSRRRQNQIGAMLASMAGDVSRETPQALLEPTPGGR